MAQPRRRRLRLHLVQLSPRGQAFWRPLLQYPEGKCRWSVDQITVFEIDLSYKCHTFPSELVQV